MKWTDTTPEAVDGAWNANATRVDENPAEYDTLQRLRMTRFVQRSIANVMFALDAGVLDLPSALTGVLVAALRTGWYVRDGVGGTAELAGMLSDAEMVELRKEIADVTKPTKMDY